MTVAVGVPAAADSVSKTTPPGPGEVPVIDGVVDVPVVDVHGVGVTDVFVNGQRVLKNGEHTGARPGRALWGPGKVKSESN